MTIEKLAEKTAFRIGSAASIILHLIVFAVWLCLPFFTSISWEITLLSLTTFITIETQFASMFNQLITNKVQRKVESVTSQPKKRANNHKQRRQGPGRQQLGGNRRRGSRTRDNFFLRSSAGSKKQRRRAGQDRHKHRGEPHRPAARSGTRTASRTRPAASHG